MANEIYQQILTNQNAEYRANQAQRESIDTQLTQALANLDTLANRVYGYTHTAIVTDDLEKDYQDIITANPDLANVSAVGLLAILSDGDTVTVQGNRMFINGEEEQADYSFSGENSENGIEVVKIWYFEKDAALQLLKLNMTIIKCSEITKNANPPVLSTDFYDGINSIEYDTIPSVKPIGVTQQKNTYSFNFPNDKISDQAIAYESLATTIGQQNKSFVNNSVLRKISFPNLRQISVGGVTNQCFCNIQNLTELNLPNLKRIENNVAGMSAPFNNLPKVVLPKDMKYVGKWALNNIRTLLLYCTQAEFNNDWFEEGSPTRFELVCGVGEWEATVNLKVAATSWNNTGKFGIPPTGEENNSFYLYALLYDFGNEWIADEHTITIPLSQYTNEAKEYFKNKNWTLVGA